MIFGGRVVAEIAVEDADEPALLRAAYDLPPDVPMPEEVAATVIAEEATTGGAATNGTVDTAGTAGTSVTARMTAAAVAEPRPRQRETDLLRWARRNSWTLGLVGLLVAFLVLTILIQPSYGAEQIQGLADRCAAARAWRPSPRRSS